MNQPGRESSTDKFTTMTLGERLGAGLAIDVVFGVVLVVASAATPDFGVAFFVAMGIVVAVWALARFAYSRSEAKQAAVHRSSKDGGDAV